MALEFVWTLFLSLCFFVPAADSDVCDEGTFCLNNGICYYDEHGHEKCQCPTGYTGKRCEHSNDCDDGTFCLNSGTCYYDHGGHVRCQCPTGYTGKHCEHGEPCKHIVCQHGGTCNERDGRCQCQAGFVGDLCEVVDSCDVHIICYNGGSCYFNNSANVAACRCPVDFTGYRCESQISTTTTTSHVTNPPSTTTASNHPQTSVSTTRNPACAKYDPGSRACIDNSACSLLHVKEVICPDPNEAHYCPVTCGCCLSASHIAAVVG